MVPGGRALRLGLARWLSSHSHSHDAKEPERSDESTSNARRGQCAPKPGIDAATPVPVAALPCTAVGCRVRAVGIEQHTGDGVVVVGRRPRVGHRAVVPATRLPAHRSRTGTGQAHLDVGGALTHVDHLDAAFDLDPAGRHGMGEDVFDDRLPHEDQIQEGGASRRSKLPSWTGTARWPRWSRTFGATSRPASSASVTPSGRSTSSVRVCTMNARDERNDSPFRSTMRTRARAHGAWRSR